ncbi:MAG: methyl-accepting chemotaxis protein [Solibacillus sp.]
MKSFSISTKINVLIISSITIIAIAIILGVNYQIEKTMLQTYEKNLLNLSTSNYQHLDARYEGSWAIQNNALTKGNVNVESITPLLDDMGSDMNIVSTIFSNDTRVATNVQIDGKRAIGTQASKAVSKKVLNGETYIGVAEVVGSPHLTVYKPLQNAQGEIIGMWFVGQSIEAIDAVISNIRNTIILIILVIGFITVGISLFFARKIVQPLHTIRKQLHDIAQGEGDLTQELHVHSKDEIGDLAVSFNQMLATLRTMMREISNTSAEITTSCEDLYASASQTVNFSNDMTQSLHSVADGAQCQREIAQQSEANISSLHHDIDSVAEAIEHAESNAEDTSKQARKGNEIIQKVVVQMETIRWSVSESEKVIQRLGNQSNEIGSISDVITNIADQTNLLALNAAIEAARAGEHGKGFAVVAEEVRHLAEQSKQSAHQITQLITAVQANTNTAVKMMSTGTMEVTSGIEIVGHTETAFSEIASSINSISQQFTQITQLTNKMEASIKNVHDQTTEMTSIAEGAVSNSIKAATISAQELAATEEVTASTKSLEQASEGLQLLINRFKF